MRILVVDDEPIVLKQMDYLIRKIYPHWEVLTCADGIQALPILKKNIIQLAILDIELPGKNGLSLAKVIKEDFPNVNIIMLSAHQDFSYAKDAIQIGVDYYLTKPIIEKELKDALSQYVEIDQHAYSNIVIDAINVIQKHYQDKLNLTSVAERIHINSSYLSRKFHEETGMKFSDFVLDYRIQISKGKLIKNRSESISSIAANCGFNSLHYFSATFKKKEGVTPKEFREGGFEKNE